MAESHRPPVPQTTVKALFARSANRCSLCHCAITELPRTEGDKIVSIGKIAHINAVSSDGPRGVFDSAGGDINRYDNLILVCGNCHDKIDRQEVTYSVSELKRIKKEHEDRIERLTSRVGLERAKEILEQHRSELKYTYEKSALQFVYSVCTINNQSIVLDSQKIDVYATANIQVLGGSGRGKSLLARTISMQGIKMDQVPVLLEAIQFVKQIDPLAEKPSGLATLTFREIEEACDVLDKKILLIIDGYNECSPEVAIKLNLWIIAFRNRHEARIVITTQYPVKGLEELSLITIEIPAPEKDTKRAIARLFSAEPDLEQVDALLEAVKTGLEARLIGEISKSISPEAGRYEIFDRYARHRLGPDAQRGISALCVVAKFLYEHITFSISAREFDRLMSANQLDAPHAYLFNSGLLVNRGDRVYFGHELFFNAFAAEAVVRGAKDDALTLVHAIALPKHREQSSLILGAIDEYALLEAVLTEIEDFNIIVACIMGDCGVFAKQWAESKCNELFIKIKQELDGIAFGIFDIAKPQQQPSAVEIYMWRVLINKNTAYAWSEQEITFIHALPLLVINGKCIPEIFEICLHTDERLNNEFTRLRPEATVKRVSLRSNMFREMYLGFATVDVSTSMIMKNFSNGGWSIMELPPSPALLAHVKTRIETDMLTNGQLYLVLQLVHLFRFRNQSWRGLLAPVLVTWLRKRWKYSPYHLKLSLLDAAHYADDSSTEQKDEVIKELNILLENSKDDLMLPSMIIDALQALGALENDELEYQKTVRTELRRIFADELSPNNHREAYFFHQKSFDHPYYSAYWEVIHELSETDAKKLYVMAVRGGVSQMSSFGLSIALYRLAHFEDPATADYFLPYCALPMHNDTMPQEGMEVFMLAHIVLGWLGKQITFSHNESNGHAASALRAYAEILYWLNRRDIPMEERKRNTSEAWKILSDHERAASVGALMNCHNFLNESISNFAKDREVMTDPRQLFTEQVVEIYRQGIIHSDDQVAYFRWRTKTELVRSAMLGLGEMGNLTDIPLLKKHTDTEVGDSAIRAIEKIESRFRV